MKMKPIIWVAAAFLAVLASCQKKDSTPVDTTKVDVLFTSLVSGQIFSKGDTIPVEATITYPGEIVGIYAGIYDSATGNELFEDDADTHTSNFKFSTEWVDTLSSPATLQVKFTVFLANNTSMPAERVLYIKSQP